MNELELIGRQSVELRAVTDRHLAERREWEAQNGPIVLHRYELAHVRGIRFLTELLSAGSVSANEVKALAQREGLGVIALQRAKREAGVLSVKRGSCWVWELPVQNHTDLIQVEESTK